jgi:hypothetical protein
MCYPTPGPRCSNHAYKEYIDAQHKFASCSEPNEKILLGDRLEEKKAIYETTPRGQHELRRNADLAKGIEREQFLLRLKTAEETRKQQLAEYNYAIVNKDTSYVELMAEKGYRKGRYQDACGITIFYLTQRYPNKEFDIENINTITFDDKKIFVIPEKYQKAWGVCKEDNGFTSEDETLNNIFSKTFNPAKPSPNTEKEMMEWFTQQLKNSGYSAIASVNRATQDVAIADVDDIAKFYSVSFKLQRRLGGSTNYVGKPEVIEELIKDTVFEAGKVLQPEGAHKTAIYGVPPQIKEDCILDEELYASWRLTSDEEDGYFEVRRRHISNNFNVIVCLKAKRQVSVTGITSNISFK